ncbi:rho guanine nucleotide exchange factor TIAM1-like [Pleurodeles waltl]|uniref:rho guanine nucleotide exchange factor TIAM1-like n=1 Tax=Pleurodeles waltl TaxID=8319 RepID=UPI0037096834
MIEDRDAFRFRHMISFEALQIRSLASGDAETNLVCEIVHVKSESEGRPEQSFHLCSSFSAKPFTCKKASTYQKSLYY